MAISSFSKDFTLNTKKEVDSFIKIVVTPYSSMKIDRKLVSSEKEKRGELKLTQMFFAKKTIRN